MTHCKNQESNYLILNKKSAWARGLPVNLRVSDEGLEIRQNFEYTEEREIELKELTGGFEVTDFAVGQCGLIYILDAPQRAVWIYDAQQKRIEPLACLGALFSANTRSLVYVPGTLYLTDTEAEHRIMALAEINWQIRWTAGANVVPDASLGQDATETASPFAPVDLAVDAQGNLYALDATNRAVVKFDAAGRFVSVFGHGELSDLKPNALALSRDGALYVLDTDSMRVLKFLARDGGVLKNADLIPFRELIRQGRLPSGFVASSIAVDASGNLFIGDGRAVGGREDDRFIRRFDASGAYLGEVVTFRGQVEKMVVGEDDWIYIFNNEASKKIFILKPEQKYSRLEGTSLVKGRYFSKSLDSADSATEWHKYVFDAELPSNTQIQVSYFAADDKQVYIGDDDNRRKRDLDEFLDEAMSATDEQLEKVVGQLDKLEWSSPVVNAKDALILKSLGRYLWLRIELVGAEKSTPVVRRLRVDFPRTSYLRYLPAVYQEDERSRDFLERFLALFETFFGGLEREIDHVARYFDAAADATSGEYLRWLSSWLAVGVDKSWTEEKLRALVLRAPALYRKRGTREGLEEMIEIFTGERPLVIEHFQRKCGVASDEKTRSEDATSSIIDIERLFTRLYGDDPYCFCVLLKPFQVRTEEERKTVRRILDAEKPAHTCAGMHVLQPWVYLDMHTYLGINTYLSQPSARLDQGGAVPRDTVLGDADAGGQLERQSRLGLDITLT
ncbi:MAG TPA: phage tail protein [Pyrinomonadaceae bacterium]